MKIYLVSWICAACDGWHDAVFSGSSELEALSKFEVFCVALGWLVGDSQQLPYMIAVSDISSEKPVQRG